MGQMQPDASHRPNGLCPSPSKAAIDIWCESAWWLTMTVFNRQKSVVEQHQAAVARRGLTLHRHLGFRGWFRPFGFTTRASRVEQRA